MSEPTRSPEIKFDEWARTPVSVRRLLLELRRLAAQGDKSLKLFESNQRKTAERFPPFHTAMTELLASLRTQAEAAQTALSGPALSPGVTTALKAASNLALQAEDVHRQPAASFHVAAGPLLANVRAAAAAIPPLYTLLARLDEEPERAVEKWDELRRGLVRQLTGWGSPLPEDQADEALDRVTRRLEEGVTVKDPAHYCCGVAYKVWQEYLAQAPRELPDADLPAPPAADADEAEQQERHFQRLRECLLKQPPETRWLLTEYTYPDYRGKEKSVHREQLADLLGLARAGLTMRVYEIRQGLLRCRDNVPKK